MALTSARLGVRVDRAQATGTIADDDAAPTVSVQPRTVAEGDTSLTDTPVRFSLSAPSGKEVVARYSTADVTATAGADYVASAATIRFLPGETEDVVHLAGRGDTVVEPAERFAVTVTHAENGTPGEGADVTLEDDERYTVSVTAPTVVEGTDATTTAQAEVTVAPAPLPGTQVEVPWTAVEAPLDPEGRLPGAPVDAPGDVTAGAARSCSRPAHPPRRCRCR
jgi:hypothetical protein